MSIEDEYDGVRESDDYYKQMESDFDAIIGGTMDLGHIRTFGTGATRDTDEDKLDWEGFISPFAMYEFVQYMHFHRTQSDGSIRDSDNWKKGFPRKQIMKSLIRHIWDLWRLWSKGIPDDDLIDLLCAILFNTQAMLHEIAVGRDVSE